MCPHVSYHNFPVIRTPSLAQLLVLSTPFETWECSLTVTLDRPLMSRCFASSVTFVNTSLTTTSTLWWCRSCTHDSITATSSWSGFLFTYSGASSLFSTLRLVWYFDYVVTTMSWTPLQLYTGCVYHKVLSSRWLSCVSGVTWSRTTIPESAGCVSPTCPDVADFDQHRQTNCSCHHSN